MPSAYTQFKKILEQKGMQQIEQKIRIENKTETNRIEEK